MRRFSGKISYFDRNSGLAQACMFHHIVAARYCGFVREAAALPGRFLPELGRFGMSRAAFFLNADHRGETRGDSRGRASILLPAGPYGRPAVTDRSPSAVSKFRSAAS